VAAVVLEVIFDAHLSGCRWAGPGVFLAKGTGGNGARNKHGKYIYAGMGLVNLMLGRRVTQVQ
jgi:hypothetical protein